MSARLQDIKGQRAVVQSTQKQTRSLVELSQPGELMARWANPMDEVNPLPDDTYASYGGRPRQRVFFVGAM